MKFEQQEAFFRHAYRESRNSEFPSLKEKEFQKFAIKTIELWFHTSIHSTRRGKKCFVEVSVQHEIHFHVHQAEGRTTTEYFLGKVEIAVKKKLYLLDLLLS